MTARRGPSAVAIPARNESDRIVACLQALDAQVGARLDHIVVVVNNSTDATAARARCFPAHPATRIHVLERDLPPCQANAGHARHLAMEAAFGLVGPHGILLTTDADGEVDPDWLSATMAALRGGADAVAGWVELDAAGHAQIPQSLHDDDARECAYDALCDEIHARLDPDAADPMPRHTQNSGASIAVTAAAYRRCGGIPDVSVGEDRAFIAALRRVDARVRHAPEVHVTVSGRTEGRSPGGMADTIRRRLIVPDAFPGRPAGAGDRLRPAGPAARRPAPELRRPGPRHRRGGLPMRLVRGGYRGGDPSAVFRRRMGHDRGGGPRVAPPARGRDGPADPDGGGDRDRRGPAPGPDRQRSRRSIR